MMQLDKVQTWTKKKVEKGQERKGNYSSPGHGYLMLTGQVGVPFRVANCAPSGFSLSCMAGDHCCFYSDCTGFLSSAQVLLAIQI